MATWSSASRGSEGAGASCRSRRAVNIARSPPTKSASCSRCVGQGMAAARPPMPYWACEGAGPRGAGGGSWGDVCKWCDRRCPPADRPVRRPTTSSPSFRLKSIYIIPVTSSLRRVVCAWAPQVAGNAPRARRYVLSPQLISHISAPGGVCLGAGDGAACAPPNSTSVRAGAFSVSYRRDAASTDRRLQRTERRRRVCRAALEAKTSIQPLGPRFITKHSLRSLTQLCAHTHAASRPQ